jgi:hypothetical protein
VKWQTRAPARKASREGSVSSRGSQHGLLGSPDTALEPGQQEGGHEVRQLRSDEERVAPQAAEEGLEHIAPLAERRSLDVRLQCPHQLLGQGLIAEASADLAESDHGTEAGQDLDGIAKAVKTQDVLRLGCMFLQGDSQHAGQVEKLRARRGLRQREPMAALLA